MSCSTVSALITTFERPAAAERAARSALAQDPSPLEVIVCDDGSADDTADRFRDFERREPRLRYVRTARNFGTPGPARNLGVELARGDWVALLDDDDQWLDGKLARQLAVAEAEHADVVATNGIRTDDSVYFLDAPPLWRPGKADLLRDNPVIVSSALVRREALLATDGFLTERWARGVADYAMWLSLVDRGASFVVLGEPLVRYESADEARMSAAPVRQEFAAARVAWRRYRRCPRDRWLLDAALRKTAAAARVAGETSSPLARKRRRASPPH